MSNFFLADRVKETSRTEGITSILLDGAVNGFSSFDTLYASGDLVFYAITDNLQYEVGSGIYEMNGSHRSLTRNPIKSSNITSGPYYVNATSNSGPTDGNAGYFYPLWLTKSSAISGVGFSDGPYTAVSGITFDEFPGVTFYHVAEHSALGVGTTAGSGSDYEVVSAPINFGVGLKEVFVTYPGKTSVYTGFGIADGAAEPKHSGVAFWRNEQIINYSSEFVWDDDNGLLGINQPNPQFAIDVGGLVSDSLIRASGFIDGGSGISFSGGQLTDTTLVASGGRQLEPFLRNRKGTNADGVIELSGIVDQIIGFADQPPATVFAGPISGYCGSEICAHDSPTFRQLLVTDLPGVEDIQNAYGFVIQKDVSINTDIKNVADAPFTQGMVALYHSSGNITYDSGIFYDATNQRLSVGGDDTSVAPLYTLDIVGDSTLQAASGYFNQLIFTDDLIRIGDENNNTNTGNNRRNFYVVSIGKNATTDASGVYGGVLVGKSAGTNLGDASGVIGVGINSLNGSYEIVDVVSIGQDAGFVSSGITNAILVGKNAGYGSSGVNNIVTLGENAGSHNKDTHYIVALGASAGSGLENANYTTVVGENAGAYASGLYNVVGIGRSAARGASGLNYTYLLGNRPASGSFDFEQVVGLGGFVAGEASGLIDTIAIGQKSAKYAKTLKDVAAVGQAAARSGLELYDTVAFGRSAAESASGSFNVYLGTNAGVGVSGHNNIEIIASGRNVDFLTHEASGKINIGKTIVGDVYSKRVKVGNLLDASNPNATFEILPADAEDLGLLISHVGSGGHNPYFACQSGDGTVLFHITNSGDVVASGFMNPSGGLKLNDHVPDSVINKLYNDGGTLYWNGTQVDTAGSTTLNVANDTTDPAATNSNITTYTNGQLLTVSGDNGIVVNQVGRFLTIDGQTLQDAIADSDYSFNLAASGDDTNASHNRLKLMDSSSNFVIKGVSGIGIDFVNFDDGAGLSSGIFVVGYDPTASYTWDLSVAGTTETVAHTDQINIVGVSGLALNFDTATGRSVEIGAYDLSGVLYNTTMISGEYLFNEILNHTIWNDGVEDIPASAIAIWASGEAASFTTASATSGIYYDSADKKYALDPLGSGHLTNLVLNSGGSQILTGSFDELNTPKPTGTRFSASPFNGNSHSRSVFIGLNAGGASEFLDGSVVIGRNAGQSASGDTTDIGNLVFVGPAAGQDSTYSDYAVGVGSNALRETRHVNYSVAIGRDAGYQASGAGYLIAIGRSAGQGSSASAFSVDPQRKSSILIGYQAGMDASGLKRDVMIGYQAGQNYIGGETTQYTTSQNVFVGGQAGLSSTECLNTTAVGAGSIRGCSGILGTIGIGFAAGQGGKNLVSGVFVGYKAGWFASGDLTSQNTIAIGTSAGEGSYNANGCTFIGFRAGAYSSGVKNSISIQHSSALLDSNSMPRDFQWAPTGVDETDNNYLIDIGRGIQGYVRETGVDSWRNGSNIHIGRSLDDYGTVNGIDSTTIENDTLSVTPRSIYHSAISLHLMPAFPDGFPAMSRQAGPMIQTEYRGKGAITNRYDDGDAKNIIVDGNGLLRIPVCQTYTGTIGTSSLELQDVNGNTIAKNAGVIVMINNSTLGTGIAISNGSLWYKINSSQL